MIKKNCPLLISGATDGLGNALAKQLSEKYNLTLILCGRSSEKMEALVKDISLINPQTICYTRCFGITNDSETLSFLQAVNQSFKVDTLINNAGANIQKPFIEEVEIEDLRYMFNLNCAAHLLFIQSIYPHMKERQEGHIINILSSVCLFANEQTVAYSASKHAMNSIHKLLMKETRPHHVKVTGIYPGGINTHFRETQRLDYMNPNSVAQAIIAMMELPADSIPQELVLRPFVENNF